MATRILGYLRPYRGRFALAVGIALLEAALITLPLLALKILVDRLTDPQTTLQDILLPAGLAVAGAITAALIGVLSTYLVQTIGEGIVHDLREQLFGRLLDRGSAFYTRSRGGDILSRVLSDAPGGTSRFGYCSLQRRPDWLLPGTAADRQEGGSATALT